MSQPQSPIDVDWKLQAREFLNNVAVANSSSPLRESAYADEVRHDLSASKSINFVDANRYNPTMDDPFSRTPSATTNRKRPRYVAFSHKHGLKETKDSCSMHQANHENFEDQNRLTTLNNSKVPPSPTERKSATSCGTASRINLTPVNNRDNNELYNNRVNKLGDDTSDDEFSGDDMFNEENIENTLTQIQKLESRCTSSASIPCNNEFKAIEIYSDEDEFDHNFDLDIDEILNESPREKYRFKTWTVESVTTKKKGFLELELASEFDEAKHHTLHLYGVWSEIPAFPGIDLYFEGRSVSDICSSVSADYGHCIIYPALLLPITRIVDSLLCSRRASIIDCAPPQEPCSATIIGKVIHTVFQHALCSEEFSKQSLSKSFDTAFNEALEDAVQAFISKTTNLSNYSNDQLEIMLNEFIITMKTQASAYLERISQFGKRFCGGRKSKIDHPTTKEPRLLGLNSTVEIEESVWSIRFGIRGKIDATSISDAGKIIPIELKTGKFSTYSAKTHFAQCLFYTMMIKDRYSLPYLPYACLIYLEPLTVMVIDPRQNELADLIMARNSLAYDISRISNSESFGPPMLPSDNNRLCQRCHSQKACVTLQKLDHKVIPPDLDQVDQADIEVLEFVDNWLGFIKLEERCNSIYQTSFWMNDQAALVNSLNFIKYENGVAHFSLLDPISGQVDDLWDSPLLISDESGRWALARGHLLNLDDKMIQIKLEQNYNGLRSDNFKRYRLDKDLSKLVFQIQETNIVSLAHRTDIERVRELIVKLSPPEFTSLNEFDILESIPPELALNSDQVKAILHTISAKDYSLILGMPGTGKTTTVAALILILLKKNYHILLASHTHTAVDNMLLKLIQYWPSDKRQNIVRIGALNRIRPELRHLSLQSQIENAASNSERIFHVYNTSSQNTEGGKLVASTCLSAKHFMISHNIRKFDICIIDEAGQIPLPASLGPIFHSKKFVLVGDPFQLAPLSKSNPNKGKSSQGYSESLYLKLMKAHDYAVVELQYQYRMNKDIMSLSNHLIYNKRLKMGEDFDNNETSENLRFETFCEKHQEVCKVQNCFSLELIEQNVIFFDLDSLADAAFETKDGESVVNNFEASLILKQVKALLHIGIDPDCIGVISLYRSQMRLLQRTLPPSIECTTVDQFQGRDKSIMLVSFVRNNNDKNPGELVGDSRRINVILTRAKSKLLMFGSVETLEADPFMKRLFEFLLSQNWIIGMKNVCQIV